jgi:CheY-like chemotaxis protein
MSELDSFGKTARDLSKNPLGIIALFIVLVYAMASLVLIEGNKLTTHERDHFVWFLVAYPVLVILLFSWLVIRHVEKLYAPADFKDQSHWMELRMRAAVAVGAASSQDKESDWPDVNRLANVISDATYETNGDKPRLRALLWVDDRAERSNAFARTAFESLGWGITLVRSTDEAMNELQQHSYDAIISDMRRPEGDREGHRLLKLVREAGINTPFYIHSGENSADLVSDTMRLGGNGHTSSAGNLFEMVVRQSLMSRNAKE